MRRTFVLTCAVLAGLLPAAGCSKPFNLEVTKDLKLGEELEQPIDGFSREQKIRVTVTPTGGPVDVFVYLEKDKEEATKSIYGLKDDKLLASARKVADGTEAKLEATIPAQSPAVVLVGTVGKKVTVKLKVTN